MELSIFDPQHRPSEVEKENITGFLYTHLGQYGDEKQAILNAINYAVGDADPSLGGFVLVGTEAGAIIGVVVVNKTGMKEYVPGHILVYIATHEQHRGKGTGGRLMQEAIGMTDGDVSLHVEPDNPAKRLYERLGFENKYLEMRFVR